jgi:hypothetical protein
LELDQRLGNPVRAVALNGIEDVGNPVIQGIAHGFRAALGCAHRHANLLSTSAAPSPAPHNMFNTPAAAFDKSVAGAAK